MPFYPIVGKNKMSPWIKGREVHNLLNLRPGKHYLVETEEEELFHVIFQRLTDRFLYGREYNRRSGETRAVLVNIWDIAHVYELRLSRR